MLLHGTVKRTWDIDWKLSKQIYAKSFQKLIQFKIMYIFCGVLEHLVYRVVYSWLVNLLPLAYPPQK